ncbi:ABC transporter ATP-binding protein [Clostridium sp. AM58-1XD]|uniref:ABC transporter ATP-binding protein n=1 Tax=Clostridium sp. AM58-1XD TaxID=2292307 RepID=UPI000E5043FB|nr:ABC transporter ATP-binding protein [Clostridium sp. AM58-1XD]RGY99606.1 ABC transporter ATP-binding protein [Clostridium sp. AM58-1XD]
MIECRELYKSFGSVQAVKGVSMNVPDGTFLGLLGPNGAGKTTLMRMMTGLLVPDSGSVAFDGRPMNRNAVDVKRSVGVTSQHINLDKELTVEENMEFTGRLYRMSKAEIADSTDRLLTFMGLDSVRGRIAQNLSGGMKRKLMIARALIHNPRYLFLDEPTVGIDPNARRDIWDFLRIQHKEGKTILLTTHYIEEAQHLCSDVMMIDEGKIFREDTPEALIAEIGPFKVEYDTGERMESEFFRELAAAKARSAELEFPCSVLPSTLEDVFFRYTSRGVEGWK